DQPYQYRGIDLYAARCAVLHTYSAEAELHRKDSSVRQFGYSNGGLHFFKPSVSENLVIIGAASFINDVIIGVERFLKDALEDMPEDTSDKRARLEEMEAAEQKGELPGSYDAQKRWIGRLTYAKPEVRK
ncbi:MAG: hypothetical protein IH905_11925, partial [Proteobacteria bacterium]|nr:hypothetical protein [Pseudomonadota bacterium]